MKIKKQLAGSFFMIIILFNQLICSADSEDKTFVKTIKKTQENIQESVAQFAENVVEKKDNFNSFDFLKIFEKNNKENKKNDYFNVEEKIENLSQNYPDSIKKIGIKNFQKLYDFFQNRATLAFSVKPDDTITCDKIGGISAGLTIMIIAALRKKSSFSQRAILPVLSSFIIYKLVSTNQELKASICKKMELMKNKIK